jgi:uncharacterized protein (TIGR02270 family)
LPAAEPRPPAPPVFWDIVEESLDEAEFLWNRWEAALVAPNQRLDDISTWIEDRLLGSIDGLVAPGAAAIDRVLAPALESDRPSRVAAAAHALITGGAIEGIACFSQALVEAEPAARKAMRRGLELADRVDIQTVLAELATPSTDERRAIVLDAASFRHCFVPIDLQACFSSPHVDLQRAAAAQLRFAPVPVQAEWLDRALQRLAPAAQPAAVETALLAGHRAALDLCRDLATADIAARSEMILLLAVLGTSRDHDRIVSALAKPDRRRAAIWALGFAGRKAGAAACVDLLAQGVEIKLAAEALAAITGLDLVASAMVAAAPPESEEPIAFEDDDLDADLVGGPEDALPEPDIPAIIRWWSKNQTALDDHTRYLGGRPITFESLQEALERGPARRRPPVATELAIRTGGRYSVQTRDFVGVQRGQMRRFSALPREAFTGPLARDLFRSASGR